MAMVRRNVLRVRPLGKRRSTGRTPQRVDEVWKKEMARNMPDGQKGVKRALAGRRRLHQATRLSTRRKMRPTAAVVKAPAGLGRARGMGRAGGLSRGNKMKMTNR